MLVSVFSLCACSDDDEPDIFGEPRIEQMDFEIRELGFDSGIGMHDYNHYKRADLFFTDEQYKLVSDGRTYAYIVELNAWYSIHNDHVTPYMYFSREKDKYFSTINFTIKTDQLKTYKFYVYLRNLKNNVIYISKAHELVEYKENGKYKMKINKLDEWPETPWFSSLDDLIYGKDWNPGLVNLPVFE